LLLRRICSKSCCCCLDSSPTDRCGNIANVGGIAFLGVESTMTGPTIRREARLQPSQPSDPHLPVTAEITRTPLRTAAVSGRLADAIQAQVCVVLAFGAITARHRLYATDDVAAWLDDRQYVLGQGPTVDALTTRTPVLVPDTDALQVATRWPGFAQEIVGHPVGAVFALPLLVGDTVLGTAQLHRAQPKDLTPHQVAAIAQLIADLVTAVLDDYTDDQGILPNPFSPDDGSARVAMAVGMAAVQLETNLPDALARLRGTAYTTNRPLEDIARDVLDRRLHYRPI
jgi:hypothetical protein